MRSRAPTMLPSVSLLRARLRWFESRGSFEPPRGEIIVCFDLRPHVLGGFGRLRRLEASHLRSAVVGVLSLAVCAERAMDAEARTGSCVPMMLVVSDHVRDEIVLLLHWVSTVEPHANGAGEFRTIVNAHQSS